MQKWNTFTRLTWVLGGKIRGAVQSDGARDSPAFVEHGEKGNY